MKKLAIIGASYLQEPLIQKAKQMGIETHVFAWEAGDVGEKSADYFYPISIVEKDAILDKCREIGIAGICSIASDLAAITVNYVASAMGLTGNSLEATRKSTNKHEMRLAFERRGDPSPRSYLVEDCDGLEKLELAFPVIVKPTDRSGSLACENISRNAMSSSFYYDISGLSFNPLVNKYYLQWLNELEVADKGQNNLHYGPDGRFGILSLAGAKYYVDDCSKAFALPYGFNLAAHSQMGNYENNILENEYALPIGYTYDRYLSISDYESLNAIQKQEIQLRAAALANAPASKEIEHCSLECAAKQIPVSILCI